ncbi:MFS transporter [Edwardsiella tarda]|uniref:MFS transporter n=1 Tax=Edwardsiella tarda TaxID=636 RepID=UPI00031123EE|nr:MFS transporter [Edwardsiella tarda]
MQLIKKNQSWISWWLVVIFLLYQFNVQTTYAIINEKIQTSLSISLAQVAIAASVYNWIYAICQTFSGSLLDRFGSRKTLLTPIALVVFGVYLYSKANCFYELIISQIVLAIGASVSFVGAGYVGQEWFGKEKYGLFFGYVQALAGVSSALGQLTIGTLIENINWREVILCFSYFGMVFIVIFFIFFKEPESALKRYEGEKGKVFTSFISVVVKYKIIFVIAIWGGVAFGSQLSLGVVWIHKIMEMKGFSDKASSYSSCAAWLGLGIGALIWDRIGYHRKNKRVLITMGFLLMIGMLALILAPLTLPYWMYIAAVLLFGFGNGIHMLAFSCAADCIPPDVLGTASAIINAMFFIIGGLLITIPGLLMNYFSESTSIASLILALFCAMFIALVKVKCR